MTRAGLAIVGSAAAASLCACAHPHAAPRAQAATAAPDVAPRNVPLQLFDQQTVEHDFPHLDVRHWKFKRQPLPIRSLVRFVFDIVQGNL